MAKETVIRGGVKILAALSDGTGDPILTKEAATGSLRSVATIASNPFSDATALVKNSVDPTKLAIFSAVSITTGTTRTYTLPNASGTFIITSSNGLNSSAGNIKLGGTLSELTAIVATSFAYSVRAGTYGAASSAVLEVGNNGSNYGQLVSYYSNVNKFVALNSQDGTLDMSINDVSGGTVSTLSFNANLQTVKFNDGRATKTGIEYAADYSASYTTRSLIDKAYATSLIGSLSWALTGTSTLTGVATITSNVPQQHVFTGIWTAVANNQYHANFAGSFTARAVASDNLYGYKFTPTLTSGSTSQAGIAILIQPTFGGSFTTTAALRIEGRTIIVAAASGLGLSAAQLAVYGSGTGTGVNIQTGNSSGTARMTHRDNGATSFSCSGADGVNNTSYYLSASYTAANNAQSVLNFDGGITGRNTSADTYYGILNGFSFTTGNTNQLFYYNRNGGGTTTLGHTGATIYGYSFQTTVSGAQVPDFLAAFHHSQGGLQWDSTVSPAQITANQNDYNPTGWYGATILNVTTDASRNLTSLVGGVNGRIVIILNSGSFNLVLKNDDSVTGTAANRFALNADITLLPKQQTILSYDGAASRWRAIGNWAGAGGGITNTAGNNELMKSNGTNAIPSGLFSTTDGDIQLGSSSVAGSSRTIRAVKSGGGDTDLYLAPNAAGFVRVTSGGIDVNSNSYLSGSTIPSSSIYSGVGVSGTQVTNSVTIFRGAPSSISGTPGGDVQLTGGSTSAGNADGGHVYINGGSKFGTGIDGNIGLFTTTGSFGSGGKVLFVGDRATAPGSDPTGGTIIYSESGGIMVRGATTNLGIQYVQDNSASFVDRSLPDVEYSRKLANAIALAIAGSSLYGTTY